MTVKKKMMTQTNGKTKSKMVPPAKPPAKRGRPKALVDRHFMPVSMRLDEKTRRRIEWLSKRYEGNKTAAVRVAIRRLYRAHKLQQEG